MSKILRNSAIYTIGNILPQAINFLILPIYTRYLSPRDYGIISSLAVLTSVLGVFFTLCLERSIYRLYFDFKDEQGQKDFLGTVFFVIVLNSFFMVVLAFLFRGALEKVYKSISFFPYYMLAILSCFFAIFASIPRIYLQVREKAQGFVILSIGQFLLTTSLVLWFVCVYKQGAEGQLKAGLISYLIFFPIYLFLTFRVINFTIDFRILKSSLKYSMPFIPSLLTAWVINMSSRIFIERYVDLSEVGIYSLGFNIATIGLVVISGFELAYSPYFYKIASDDANGENKRKLEQTNNIYAIVLLVAVFFVALVSKDVISFFVDPRYAKAYIISRVIVFGYLFSGLSGLASCSILQEKKSKQNMYISILAALINILFSFLLIPRFGMYGAAFSTLITFIIGYIIQYQYSKKCYFIPIQWKKLALFLYGGISIILLYQFVIEKYQYISIISKFIIVSLLAYIILTKVLKFTNIKAFRIAELFRS